MSFAGKVAVVTGAGAGLGRQYAHMLAARGAKVVVNDIGAGLRGEASRLSGNRPADIVVKEIRDKGGIAIPNFDSVEFGDSIIKTAVDNYGRIDILINNAGILRDSSFANMKPEDWDLIMRVHVKGAFVCTKAAWPYMRNQKYGRIINTTSASGMYGNFGQSNYGAAKMALVGMSNSLASEGEKYNIKVNCIAPIAGTRMTVNTLPDEICARLKPELVAPLVVHLVSEQTRETGQIFEVGGGFICKTRFQRSNGFVFGESFTPEDVSRAMSNIEDFSKCSYPQSMQDSVMQLVQRLGEPPSTSAENAGGAGPAKTFSSSEASQLKSAAIFDTFLRHINSPAAKKMAEQVACVYRLDIIPRKGEPPITFTFDVRPDSLKLEKSIPKSYDAQFIMLDDDFVKVANGNLNPQVAFLNGKMKIIGNMQAAMKFTPDLFQKLSKL